MTIIERRALLGDRQAQEEGTRQGIVLPCPCCGNETILYDTSEGDYDYGYGGYRCYGCDLGQGYNFKTEQEALANWNMRPVPPIGRCKTCANKKRATVNKKGYLICPASGMEITDTDFCSWFEPAEEEELSDSELAVDTGYKCLVCSNHKLCTTPGLKPLCGESYDHFERGCYVK